MKWILKCVLVVVVAAGVLGIATGYTRDVSGDGSKAILVALEALITDAAALEVDVAALEVDLAATEVLLAGTQKTKVWDGTTTAGVIPTILSLKGDVSSVAGTVTNVNGGNRDAGTQTVTLADNDPAVTDLAAIETAVLHNTRGLAVVTVQKNTWTALSGIGTHRYLQIVCRNSTDAATAVLNIWGSDDGGTTFFPLVRADTLAKAKDVAIDVGTDFNPTEGAGVANVDTVVVAAGPSTHIYIHEEGGAGGTFTYECGGL